MTTQTEQKAFSVIVELVSNLHEYFGESKVPSIYALNLYYRLISKCSDEDVVSKHVSVFRGFCIANRTAISKRDSGMLVETIIRLSERVYLDIMYMLKHSDMSTQMVIWEYILSISAYLDPENKAKELLQTLRDDKSKEGNFIASMIETVGAEIDGVGNSNPFALIGTLMNSGVLSSLLGTMNENVESGQLDISKLMGTVSGLVENVKLELEKSDDPMMKSMVQMMNQMQSQPSIEDVTSDVVEVEEEAVSE